MNIQEIYDKLWSLCEKGPLRCFSMGVHPDNKINKVFFFLHFKGKPRCIYVRDRQLEKIFSLI